MLLAASLPARAQGLSGAQITRLGRPATALVAAGEAPTTREGSAFCVHPSGLFVTNHHVVNLLPIPVKGPDGRFVPRDPPIKLVLNSGREDQKVVAARVLWSDPGRDLALLRADGVSGLPSLQLATPAGLSELRDVVAFGFPLGSIMAAQGETYPSINVSKGKVRLVKSVEGEPTEIEADVSINPGNSGGPLLDGQGRVVGVINAIRENRVDHTWVGLAVPVNRLEWFLSRPEITFEPPIVLRSDRDKPVEFKAFLRSLVPPRDPLSVELVLGGMGDEARRYPMKMVDGAYRTKAVPSGGAKDVRPVRLELQRAFGGGRTIFWVEDTTIKVDGKPLRLSEVETIYPSHTRLRPGDGRAQKRTGPEASQPVPRRGRVPVYVPLVPVTGLDGILAAVRNQDVTIDPARLSQIQVSDASDPDTLLCTVISRGSGRDVFSQSVPLFLSDAQRANLAAVSQGRFFRPRRSASPVTSARFHIPAGDPALKEGNPALAQTLRKLASPGPDDPPGPGAIYVTVTSVSSATNVSFDGTVVRGGINIFGIGPAGCSVIFKGPQGGPLEPGEYVARPFDPQNQNEPSAYVELAPNIRPSAPNIRPTSSPSPAYTGRFRVWEIEEGIGRNRGPAFLKRLAVDFVLYRKLEGPGGGDVSSVSGMLRLSSSFE
jgi:hypothetical protein